jgi:hypothetical protein
MLAMGEGVRIEHRCDPWRRRMSQLAERLRGLDERRFGAQIARIEECLRVDANWNLEAALASGKRCAVAARGRGGPRPYCAN